MSKRRSIPEWVVIVVPTAEDGRQRIACLLCGEEHTLRMPMPLDDFIKRSDAFSTLHEDCQEETPPPGNPCAFCVFFSSMEQTCGFAPEEAKWCRENGYPQYQRRGENP